MSPWYVYLIRCYNGSLYTGICVDLARRFEEHQCGGRKCAKYLRGKGPLQLVFSYPAPDRSRASKFEYQLRRLPKGCKEKLIAGELKPSELFFSSHSETADDEHKARERHAGSVKFYLSSSR